MPAAVLNEWQTRVLASVKASAPHATLAGLTAKLERDAQYVRMALDALTRRGMVTPVDVPQVGEVYITTAKGRRH